MRLHRPYSTPVLPTVFDESLSYYEVLSKVVNAINSIYADTETMIRQILDDMGITPEEETRYKNVLNVKDYGAKGDGVTDDRESIQAALNAAFEAGGGIVFCPAGRYLVSSCIIIGTNCSLVGTGRGTTLELNDLLPYWGTAIGIMGSNASLYNMRILYNDRNPVAATTGAKDGAVGITNADYAQAVTASTEHTVPTTYHAYKNVIVSDIWTEGLYSIQAEPTVSLENVIYRNIYGSGSMVSIQGGTAVSGYTDTGVIKNVMLDNVTCDFLRIIQGGGGSVLGSVDGVFVTNLFTHYIRCEAFNAHFDNFIADCSVNSPYDLAGGWLSDDYGAVSFYGYVSENYSDPVRCSAKNGYIKGRTSGIQNRGLAIIAASKYIFENLTIKGFALRNVSGALGADCIWIGCDCEETGISNGMSGCGVANRSGDQVEGLIDEWNNLFGNQRSSITWGTNYAASGKNSSDSFIEKNGNVVYGTIAALKSSGLTLNDVICTVPYKPETDTIMYGQMVDVSQDDGITSPAFFKINTAGQITLYWNARHTPSQFNFVIFNILYTVGGY